MDPLRQVANRKAGKRRTYPFHPLENAKDVGETIQNSNSGLPMDRFLLSKALNTTPKSSGFVMKLNSSSRYGITAGGYNDATISLTELGKSLVAAKTSEERKRALVECAIKPDVFREFYQRMDGKQVPEFAYAKNILERDHQVNQELSKECFDIIVANGLHVKIIQEVKGLLWVNLTATLTQPQTSNVEEVDKLQEISTNKVFIGHFGDLELLEKIEILLDEFKIEFVVVNLSESKKSPLASKANYELKNCHAAIILADNVGSTEPNYIYRLSALIGAASMLYGNKLLLIGPKDVTEGIKQLGLNTIYKTSEDPINEIQILKALNNTNVINISV